MRLALPARYAALVAFAGLAGLAPACHQAPPEQFTPPGAASPVASATSTATPIDHLAPGELVEGSQKAFGLPLPRDLPIDRQQPGSVRAIGPVTVHSLVKFFKPRLQDGRLTEGDTYASFDQAKIGGQPGKVFRVRITELPPRGTLVDVDDVTPPPVPDLPDEAARWRQVGLTPQGKPLDPTHLD